MNFGGKEQSTQSPFQLLIPQAMKPWEAAALGDLPEQPPSVTDAGDKNDPQGPIEPSSAAHPDKNVAPLPVVTPRPSLLDKAAQRSAPASFDVEPATKTCVLSLVDKSHITEQTDTAHDPNHHPNMIPTEHEFAAQHEDRWSLNSVPLQARQSSVPALQRSPETSTNKPDPAPPQSNAIMSQDDEHSAEEKVEVDPYDMPPVPTAYRIDNDDPIHAIAFFCNRINLEVENDVTVNETLDLAHDSWEVLSVEKELLTLKGVYFCVHNDYVHSLTLVKEHNGVIPA